MKIALFTIVKNEQVFLPLWYKYYTKQFDPQDIYVYDNNSDEKYSVPITRNLESEFSFDHSWLRSMAYKIMAEHLKEYDYVMCVDADEILIPDRRVYTGIHDYVVKNSKKILYSTGYEIISKIKSDPIDFKKSLLQQRENWIKLANFYKPVLSTVPIKKMYSDYNDSTPADPDLYLVHLNRIDYKTALLKNQRERSYKWSKKDLAKTNGWQHRLPNNKAFNNYYMKIKNSVGVVKPIPNWIKEVI